MFTSIRTSLHRTRPSERTVTATPFSGFYRIIGFLILSSLYLAGCKKEKIDPVPVLIAHAGPDQTAQAGQLVTLDGSGSRDEQGALLTYQWAFIRKPATSAVTLTAPTTAKPTFKTDEVGEYELTLTVSNGKESRSDNVLISVSVAQPVTINADITVATVLEDRILNPALPDYIVTKSIAVKHQLTIKPGVVVAFERDVRFDITANGGQLMAQGTADQKIRFDGVNPTKGYWMGIMLFSGSNANVLEHVEIRNAGSQTLLDNKKAGLVLFKESQLAVKNSLFSQNNGYGMFVAEGALLREFSANSFQSNADAGMLLSTDNVAKLDVASTFTGNNGRNVVEIVGEYIGESGQRTDIVWNGFADKTPYRLVNDVAVRSAWILKPDVTLELGRDVSIHINESGYLNAKGTDTQKIRFTGAGTTAAYWKGILCLSPSTQNVIENAEILNAGSTPLAAGHRANLLLYGENVNMAVRKTLIGGSGGYGIFVSAGAELNADASTINTFSHNTQANVERER